MPIEMSHLHDMLSLEVAADTWWKSLSPKDQKAYLTAHPSSRYGNASKGGPDLTGHLVKNGFTKDKGAWVHKNGTRIRLRKSDTHKHHLEITDKKGNVSNIRRNTTGDAMGWIKNASQGILRRSQSKPAESPAKGKPGWMLKPPVKGHTPGDEGRRAARKDDEAREAKKVAPKTGIKHAVKKGVKKVADAGRSGAGKVRDLIKGKKPAEKTYDGSRTAEQKIIKAQNKKLADKTPEPEGDIRTNRQSRPTTRAGRKAVALPRPKAVDPRIKKADADFGRKLAKELTPSKKSSRVAEDFEPEKPAKSAPKPTAKAEKPSVVRQAHEIDKGTKSKKPDANIKNIEHVIKNYGIKPKSSRIDDAFDDAPEAPTPKSAKPIKGDPARPGMKLERDKNGFAREKVDDAPEATKEHPAIKEAHKALDKVSKALPPKTAKKEKPAPKGRPGRVADDW